MMVYSVVIPGMDDAWDCVGVFSTYEKARKFASGFPHWAIDSHIIDKPEEE